ncbi:MAG TPA: hypothetical protein VJM11_15255 [Nevskiaceae bacterium]|nr:hypothetical protein [Nevskiaceae bacterium]
MKPMRLFPILCLATLAWMPAPGARALEVELDIGSVTLPGVPGVLTSLALRCDLAAHGDATECRDGILRGRWQDQPIDVRIARGRLEASGDWAVDARMALRKLTLSVPDGKIATDQLDADLAVTATGSPATVSAQLRVEARGGQAYVEPVFVDFAAAPATLDANATVDLRTRAVRLDPLTLEQRGIVRVTGRGGRDRDGKPDADLVIEDLHVGPAFTTWVQPFLAGKPIEKTTLAGHARGRLVVKHGMPEALDLHLADVAVEVPKPDVGAGGIDGDLHWRAIGEVPPSTVRWRDVRFAKLVSGAATLSFQAWDRDVELLAPLRLPVAGGALVVHDFAVQRAGAPDMAARFDGTIEPIDLAALCRALGWPEFGGQLAGRLPGLRLQDRELALDGALTATAFDGSVTVDRLSVRDPFGRVPRVQANLRLRNLDLAALTGAFSFGRIEGRLDGDVEGLRLIDWAPVAFRARLGTPEDDGSRHRISQRAIDNISAIGGGPTGVLSRGAMRFFKEFAYDRIGWRCTLADGTCEMGGLGPAKGGGYVLVKGKAVPRIDVVGYETRVDWTTFVEQLKAARESQGVQVR